MHEDCFGVGCDNGLQVALTHKSMLWRRAVGGTNSQE